MHSNYLQLNKDAWNEKVAVHIASDFYDVAGFMKGNTSLKEIELALLGDVKDLKILHMQCHFGQDTISLARMGAEVTGVDFSEAAIKAANELNTKCGTNAKFICADIYSLPEHLNQSFDLIFTSYGTIGWLPNIDEWAKVVAHFLKPGGKFVFVEFHPVIWMYDNDFKDVTYNYFKSDPIIETENGTYANTEADISTTTISWNHSISSVVNNLIAQKLVINTLNEYDFSPFNCFNHTIELSPNKFVIKPFGNKIPMVYAIVATKQ